MKNLMLIVLVLAAIILAAWLVSRHNAPPATGVSQPAASAGAPTSTNFNAPAPGAATSTSASPEPSRTLAIPPALGGPMGGGVTEPLEAELQRVPRIVPEDLDERMKSGAVVVIDVRDADTYMLSHVTGAMHIPLSRLAGEVAYLPRDKPIVTYCTWPNEESSARAALQLSSAGIPNVTALLGGYEAWHSRGLPITTGKDMGTYPK